jgi:SAM-dependent methyltransferase
MDWYANEELWRDLYPFQFNEIVFNKAVGEVKDIIQLTEIKGGEVLDLACGPGRHALEFARSGFTVTGVDKSPYLLMQAKMQSEEEGIEVEWLEEDMRHFRRDFFYDLAINLFTSFGYFDESVEDFMVLENIYHSLKGSGRLILELNSKELIAKIYQPTTSRELEDGQLLVQRYSIEDDWSRMNNQLILINEGKAKFFNLKLRLYSAQELKSMLTQVGFINIKLFGGFKGEIYNNLANRLVILAEKN